MGVHQRGKVIKVPGKGIGKEVRKGMGGKKPAVKNWKSCEKNKDKIT